MAKEKKFSKKVVAEYLKHKGCKCPFCGSKNISAEQMEVDGADAWQHAHCYDCYSDWTDNFKLIYAEPRRL